MQNLAESEAKIRELTTRLAEAEETLQAISSGEVDALVVAGPNGDQVFTLQGAETPYRILVEEMNDGALMLIPDGTILYANSRFASFAKTPLEQIIGSSWENFFVDDDHVLLKKCLERAEPGARPEELTLIAGDKSSRPVHLALRSMSGVGVTGFSVIITDLTERKQSEDALRRTSAELLDNNKKLKAFSYSVSHDIRAPLRAMQGFAQILMEDYRDQLTEEPRSYLERIVEGANQLDRLIQDVLAYSRLTRDAGEPTSFNFDKVIRETIDGYPNLRAAQIEVVPSNAQVRGYAVPLSQCLLNLLSNAVKFVPAGRTPMVKVWAEPANGRVRIWVQDNGIGIERVDQEKIFEMFTRAATAEQFEGTGIGLSMVKAAVEKMGGAVGVESEVGKGSRFWIELETAAPT